MPRNAPISQEEVESALLELSDRLEDEIEQYEQLCDKEAHAAAAYKGEYAKVYLSMDGAIKNREYQADMRLENMHLDYKLAEGRVKSKRERLNGIKTQIEAYRTVAANVRKLV